MVLGMSLATFTLVHVIISLIGIVSGIIVMFAMLGSRSTPGMTAIFLLFTILTNATGFLFPFEGFKPSYLIDRLSLDLRDHRAALALFQRLRTGDPELPQDTGVDRAGARQSAERTCVRGGSGHRAAVF